MTIFSVLAGDLSTCAAGPRSVAMTSSESVPSDSLESSELLACRTVPLLQVHSMHRQQ